MNLHRLHALQRLSVPIGEAWAFFSSPGNLAAITPPWLAFQVTGEVPGEMHAGSLITYTIRPFPGVKVRWVTEITHVEAPRFFVDEQRFGPYRFWHHQHRFRPLGDDGTEVEDVVHYALPLGPLGGLVHALTVRRRLEEIFAYRRQALARRFGEAPAVPGT